MIHADTALVGSYDHLQVSLSVLIAVAASYAALDLAGRVNAASGWARLGWLAGGAMAMGIGIWTMHFVGMLAFSLPIPVSYHWPTVVLTLLVAVLASLLALEMVSRRRMGVLATTLSGLIMGSGIASMHYLGMMAMRMPASVQFSFPFVGLSVLLAFVFSLAALWLAFHFRDERKGVLWQKLGSAAFMGAAVSGMHYTGMAAASFTPSSAPPNFSHSVSISSLGTLGVAAVTLILLGLAILACAVDRRFDAQALQLALAGTKAELAHVSRIVTVGGLTASIAHEINQPRAAVVTFGSAALRWLAARPPQLDEAREAMTRVIREANRASEVIAKLGNLLKKHSTERRPVSLNTLTREVLELVSSQLAAAGISAKIELAAETPQVLGDYVQLQQLMLNLVMNAIDAMKPVTDRPRELVIEAAKNSHDVLVKVRDSGIGLDLPKIDRIFEPFFTTKTKGLGMGLSISRSIVEAHGGHLRATPGIPHGAVFEFTLPAANCDIQQVSGAA